MNALQQLRSHGQSPWIDDLHRKLVTDGGLQRLIDDGVCGLTSNPAIFEKAIAHGDEYDGAIRNLVRQGDSAAEVYQTLTVEDVQHAADLFRPLYEQSGGSDGFVSYEVSPKLATDTKGTYAEARELWARIDRPNVMIKVPATKEGLPVIQQLTGDGLNINVTLIFGLPRYEAVARAYIAGLRERAERGGSVTNIASVASFFLSRIDTLLDPKLEKLEKDGNERAGKLKGEVAVASAKVAYEVYKNLFDTSEFKELEIQGAKPQRLLWASTGVKNPEYAADKYIKPLIGPDTVNTMPPETLQTYLEQGAPTATLEQDLDKAHRVLTELEALGISIDDATQQLEAEGTEKFVKPFESLMETLVKAKDEAATQV
jgi:transaldolase